MNYKIPIGCPKELAILLETSRLNVLSFLNDFSALNNKIINLDRNNESYEIDSHLIIKFCWNLIDDADRIVSITKKYLNIESSRKLEFDDFIRMTEGIRKCRNTYHHMYERIDQTIDLGSHISGVVRWIRNTGSKEHMLVEMINVSPCLEMTIVENIIPSNFYDELELLSLRFSCVTDKKLSYVTDLNMLYYLVLKITDKLFEVANEKYSDQTGSHHKSLHYTSYPVVLSSNHSKLNITTLNFES